MKRLVEHYGGVVLTSILALVVMISFFGVRVDGHVGIPTVFENVIETVVKKDAYHVMSKTAFDAYKSVSAPKIKIKEANIFKQGEQAELNAWIVATDKDGVELPVFMERAWKDGSLYEMEITEPGKVLFKEAGIYWIEIRTEDDLGYVRNVLTKVFVNER